MRIQNSSMKFVVFAIMCVVNLSLGLEASENNQKKVLLKVDGEEVYSDDFDVSIRKMIKQINVKPISSDEKQKQINQLRTKKINELVQIKRMEQEAKANDIDMSQGKIEEYFTTKASKNFMSLEEYKAGFMKNEDMSEPDVEKNLKRIYVKERLGDLKFKDKVQVTEKDIDKYIQKNSRRLKKNVPEKISLVYIEVQFVKHPVSDEHKKQVEKICNDIIKKAKQGKDFYSLSKQYPQTSVYFIKKGFTEILPESSSFPFLEVLSLKKEQISDVIASQGKYLIFKAVDHQDAREMTDSQIREKAKQLIMKGKRRFLMQRYELYLLSKASVEIIDEDLKK